MEISSQYPTYGYLLSHGSYFIEHFRSYDFFPIVEGNGILEDDTNTCIQYCYSFTVEF